METLGTRLRTEREKRNWTQRSLARKAGVGATTIASIEIGRSRATTRLVDIAKALNVNPMWLETGRGPREAMPPPENVYVAAESPEDLARQLARKSDDELAEIFRLILSFIPVL
ncbi:helix-turn-helix transcriptional regulator [Chromobacterium haemolyticum]|uniref:Helix-turn-helix transcriptional regulator n=1 Tax=Chromobacterium fluminis TaxID=3044269 RepID=A0ABX0L7L3_9NEIS|nr:helix-turn-helix transcriptional regulator [Chromobacterium haemolyticum]NHR07624.1 helix-turn-helix transcriptional regulator [Chromobacterium haemolyticum]